MIKYYLYFHSLLLSIFAFVVVGSLISSLPSSLLWHCCGGFVDFSSLFVFAVAICGDLWVFVRSVLEDLGFLLACFGLDWH